MRPPASSSGPHPVPSRLPARAATATRARRNTHRARDTGEGTRLLRECLCRGLLVRGSPDQRDSKGRRAAAAFRSKFSCSAKGESVSPCRVPHMRPAASECGESAPESARQTRRVWGDRGANPLRHPRVQRGLVQHAAWKRHARVRRTPHSGNGENRAKFCHVTKARLHRIS
jgi:hypothetical protein